MNRVWILFAFWGVAVLAALPVAVSRAAEEDAAAAPPALSLSLTPGAIYADENPAALLDFPTGTLSPAAPVPAVKPAVPPVRVAAPVPPRKPDRTANESDLVPQIAVVAADDGVATLVDSPAAPVPVPAEKPARDGFLPRLLSYDRAAILPLQPLGDGDAALYRTVFRAQSAGDWDVANEALARLKDQRLRGHVLFQRYAHPSYRTRYDELVSWLASYGDQPGADRIYKMAAARKPAAAKLPPAPESAPPMSSSVMQVLSGRGDVYMTTRKRNEKQDHLVQKLIRQINADISDGAPTRALRKLNNDKIAKSLDRAETDQLRAQIASAYLVLGKPADAARLAGAAAARSGKHAPIAGWVAGLAAWRQGDYAQAAAYFEQPATSPYATPWQRAAGAYWASRSHLRAGYMDEMNRWLAEAARYPRTFYGLIATRALGWDYDFNWTAPKYTRAHFEKLKTIPEAWRAMALVDAGQNHLAEAELVRIETGNDEFLREALLAYTLHANLPGLAMRLAASFPNPEGGLYDAALYPLLPWQPSNGFSVDRALINAIIRQESRFDTFAVSSSGATGLMQLMPETAKYMTGADKFINKDGKFQLRDPEVNLEIGQQYVEHLMGLESVDEDLLQMAVAYNAGPGNLRKWKRELSDVRDPLLFIEMIPSGETRVYVERVLANYWIYRLRMGQPTPTLDSVAEGRPARYVAMDTGREIATALNRTRLAAAQ